LEVVLEVKIQYGGCPTKQNILDTDWSTFMGRPIRNEMNLNIQNKFHPTDFVPRGISSGSKKRATEYTPWVPKDVQESNLRLKSKFSFEIQRFERRI